MFNQPSTVVDFSAEVPEILRHGSGDPELLFF
jgi:tRNA A37 threonylcarbamoyladenosine synthetase subunit TsaC/SUA5/YrdC